ncbi:MAG TPA: sporulation protein [Lachnospiraceae bacterium]|nr:sporulation protein [Lachnospiraceae bacterium]
MSDFASNVETLFGKIEEFVSSKTVVGEPVTMGKVTIVPLVDISFGMGASSDNSKGRGQNDKSLAGVGAKLSPSAVLVINGQNVQMISTSDRSSVNKLMDMMPGFIDKASGFFSSDSSSENTVEVDKE